VTPSSIALAACLLGAAPVLADEPLLRPTRDVDVTYRAAGAQPLEQRVRWDVATQTVRIDPPTPGVYVIIDYVARRMSVVNETEKSVVEMAAPASMANVLAGRTAGGFARQGEAKVDGQDCTEWQTQDHKGQPADLCITNDGVLLRAGTPDRTLVTAVNVRYAPQDPALFHVPADYARRSPGASR
jgi:hypothetical protein